MLQRGVELRMEKVSVVCENLLGLEPALWNFAKHDDLEPTNNHAERVLRPAVLWRKRAFGSDSDRGCRYVERMITASAICRLQKRRVFQFLVRVASKPIALETPRRHSCRDGERLPPFYETRAAPGEGSEVASSRSSET